MSSLSSCTKSITVTYNLKPPSCTQVSADLPKQNSHSYPIQTPDEVGASAVAVAGKPEGFYYYQELRKSLEVARNEVGEVLTMWRDLVGKAELNKEPKRSGEEDEEEEQA